MDIVIDGTACKKSDDGWSRLGRHLRLLHNVLWLSELTPMEQNQSQGY